jgi:hypothetical protein
MRVRHSILLIFALVISCSGASAQRNTVDIIEAKADPPIIGDNTVVFFTISQIDYESLLPPGRERGSATETIADFVHSAMKVESKIKALGYQVIYGSWHEVKVRIGENEIETIMFEPKGIIAILMKAQGKKPKLVTEFPEGLYAMGKIISEYFNVNLR